MDNVYYLKLLSGDDIVCQVLRQDDESQTYWITNPMKISSSFDSEVGRLFMGMSKWVPLQKSKYLQLYYDHVITMSEVQDEMVEFYSDALGEAVDEFETQILDASSDFSDVDEDKVKMALYFANTSSTLN